MKEFSGDYNESESDDFFTPINPHENIDNEILGNMPLNSRDGTYHEDDFRVR